MSEPTCTFDPKGILCECKPHYGHYPPQCYYFQPGSVSEDEQEEVDVQMNPQALKHIYALLIAMDRWASDEDGVHPDAFDAYEEARAFVGQPIPLNPDGRDDVFYKGTLPLCNVPPPGWFCTRPQGHEGPCAAIPVKENK